MSETPSGPFQARVDAFFGRIGRHLGAPRAASIVRDLRVRHPRRTASARASSRSRRALAPTTRHASDCTTGCCTSSAREPGATGTFDARRAATRSPRWRRAGAGHMLDDRRHRDAEAGQALARRAAAVHRQRGQDRQLPARRQPERRDAGEQVPIDMELYLPESWTERPKRRRARRASPTRSCSRPRWTWRWR